MATLKTPLPFIAWRDGRPRFVPGARERDLGFKGEDLRHEAGAWFTEAEAATWSAAKHAEILAARAKGRPIRTKAAPSRTVGDLLDDWLNADHVKGLAPKTRDGYRKQVDAIRFQPGQDFRRGNDRDRETFSLAPVAAIGKPEVMAFIEYQIKTRGLHMARASRAVLNAAFAWGETSTRWRLAANPARDLNVRKPKGRVVIFTDAEIGALVAAADAADRASIGDAVLLGLFTGQRQGDRLALADNGLVDGRRVFIQRKTGAVVAIREVPQLRARLEAARARAAAVALRRGTRPAEIVIDETTGRPYNEHTYRHVFDDVRATAAATLPSLAAKRDQDLRDTAVTWLARAGATLPEIAGVTGHSPRSIHTILSHYLAITPELGDAAIGKLMAWMEREGMAV